MSSQFFIRNAPTHAISRVVSGGDTASIVHSFKYVIFTEEDLNTMAGEEEKLCEQMRLYQHLYDSSSQLHSNKIALENAWKEVATAMGKTVVKVKTDWKCVRDKSPSHKSPSMSAAKSR